MKSYRAFLKKEFREAWRTSRFLVILLIFLALGFMNPLTAKYTPLLLDSFLPEGMVMDLPKPSAVDSWMQFFKNVPQIGLIVLAVLYCPLISGEVNKGTLIPLMAKGLSWKSVLCAKSTAAVLLWSLSYGAAFGISWIYTWMFWKNTWYPHLGIAVLGVWSFGVLLIQLLLLGGMLFKNSGGSLLFTGGMVLIMMLLQIVPWLSKKLPAVLVNGPMEFLSGTMTAGEGAAAVLVCWGMAVLALYGSVLLGERKRLV